MEIKSMKEALVSEETQKLLKEMEAFSRKVTSTANESKKFLEKSGICTPNGNLKLVYR
jgi:hypothetical protein